MVGVDIVGLVLFAFGYPASIAVIARWIPVVREQRSRWYGVHQLAVAAIIVGWAIRGEWGSVAVNATWLVVATAWYGSQGRRNNRLA